MARIQVRKWLEENKIWFETVAAALISIMAIIVAFAQLSVMEKQSLIAERQFQSGIDPSISIELMDIGMGKNGIYNLKIKNNGALDICDVAIYENYLNCPFEQKGSHLAIDSKSFSISGISTLPMKQVPLLKPDDEVPYTIDIKKHIAETTEGTLYPCFLRLRVDYRKKVDGKPYQKLAAYGISNILFDLESEGSRAMLGNQPHIARVRELLLNNF
jgi:hypothetical protein